MTKQNKIMDKIQQTDLQQNCQVGVYVCNINTAIVCESIFVPKRRQREVAMCKNANVAQQKTAVWELLCFALKDSLDMDANLMKFKKSINGKWSAKNCFFSLSHSGNMIAVAVSKQTAVGVDIQIARQASFEQKSLDLSQRILTPSEIVLFFNTEKSQQPVFLAEKWTEKEALFKLEGGRSFSPNATEKSKESKTIWLSVDNQDYCLSVATREKALPKLVLHGQAEVKGQARGFVFEGDKPY